LLDVTPLSLGIETLGGVTTKVIEKGTTIPAKKSQIFSTAEDNQPAVSIHVVQGEREFAKDNKSLGMFELTGIPAAPRGVPQIEVTFDIDANGILTVSAVDKGTGKSQEIKITGSSGLSEEEIQQMVQDAEAHKAEDEKRKALVEAKNQADAMIHQVKKTLEELGEKVEAGLKAAAEKVIEELEALIKDDNATKEQIDSKVQELTTHAQKLAEAQAASQQQAGGSESASAGKADDDDVIDAEVE